jgi:cytoskeleton protein RodZ
MDPNDTRVASESGPGAWLRQAREDRGLPIEEVGRALNLSLRHLQSLEDDAYDKLPGPTYVRGYLRGYAMLLGIAPQPLLDAFNRLPVAAQRNEMVAPAPVRQVTSSDSLVRLGTVLIVGLVIGLAALWWGGLCRCLGRSTRGIRR